jgi:5-methylcytosine-specific restriction endonuclease McrA
MRKGSKMSAESRRKMSEAAKRRPSNRIGKKHSEETRARISAITRERTARGEAHYAYRNGAFQRNLSLRRQPEYLVWRKAVFERDRYRCLDCGDDRGGNLRAHHEKPMGEFPELAYDVDNGTTLCHTCHELRHFKHDSIRNQRKLKRGERLWR